MKKATASLLFLLILIGAFVVRLYRFDNPVADWHSWRQADTSAVSRNFVKQGFDLLHPRFDDLSNVPSGIDNPQGYRFVEFPIYNVLQAGSYIIFDYFTIEEWGRLITIASQLLALTFLYLLVKKYSDETVGLFAAFFYAFLPYNIYYGRTILPDPSMVMAILGGTYFFDRWLSEKKDISLVSPNFIASLIFTAVAFLLKPYALFFTLPYVALSWNKYNWQFVKKYQLWIFAIISLIPLIAWRVWMMQYPEGIPQSLWLFNGGNIRFKPSFFHWIISDRLVHLILGFFGMTLIILGTLISSKSEKLFHFLKGQTILFYSFLLSSILYVCVIARGNVQHDYYQILIIPSVVIFAALGCKFFLSPPLQYMNRKITITFLIIGISYTLFMRWYVVRDYFNINNEHMVTAGKEVDKLIPKDAKVIAQLDGDTSFLYQINRQGWASFEKDLPIMIQMGADYLVLVNPTEKDLYFSKDYKIVKKTPEYLLYDLHQSP